MYFRFNIVASYGIVLCRHQKWFIHLFFKVSFHWHIQVFSCEILSVWRLKYRYFCFYNLCFLFIVVQFMSPVLFLVVVISLHLLFFMQFSSPRVFALKLYLMLASSPPLLLLTRVYCLCHLSDIKPYALPIIIIIIIIQFSALHSVSFNHSRGLYQGPRMTDGSNFMYAIYLCLLLLLGIF